MKKFLNIVKTILVWAFVLAAVGMMVFTIFSVTTFDQNNRAVFGYKFFIARSDSMMATDFASGDIVFVKEVDPATLKEGDIIAYISRNSSNYGETVTHKIRALTTDENGDPGFITYGTTTNTDDETVVTYAYVLGRYVGALPKVGKFFSFLKTTPGYILCILVPFTLLIVYNGVNCIALFRRYKREQTEKLEREHEKLRAEREESARMLRELEELRAQLGLETKPEAADGDPLTPV